MKLQTVMAIHPVTIGAHETVAKAAARMRNTNVGCLVVMNDRAVAGIITDRDLVIRCTAEGHEPVACTVADHMSHPVIARTPDMDVLAAAHVMTEAKVKRMVVIDAGELVGIVSLSDIALALDKPVHELLLGMGAAHRMSVAAT